MRRLSPAEVAALNAAQAKRDAPVIEGVAEVQTIIGKTGPAGKDGRDGVSVQGLPGPGGRDGIDGRNGVDGKSIIGPRGLAGPAGTDGVGPDEKVKVDAQDPSAGFLSDKLKAGIGIQIRKAEDGRALVLDSIGTSSSGIPGGGAPGPKGDKGDPGPAGPPGTGGLGVLDLNFVYVQESASTSWTVVHNLGKRPAVQVVDSAGTQVEGDVTWLNNNTVRLDFNLPFSGRAFLN